MSIELHPAQKIPSVFNELIQSRGIGERVIAMTYAIDFANNPILDSLIMHGSTQDIAAVDYFGHKRGPSFRLTPPRHHQDARNEFEEKFPGSYEVLCPKQPNKLFIANRSHIKALAVGSKILSLGGVNFTNYSYGQSVDAMLDFESVSFADFLTDFVAHEGNMREAGPGESIRIDDQNTALIDYGQTGQSVIMDSVFYDLADENIAAVSMSSSYAPAGHLLHNLAGIAEADKRVTIYTNSLKKFRRPHQSLFERRQQREDFMAIATINLPKRRRLLEIHDYLPTGKFNHLKSMVMEKQNGGRVAYIGSHNFHPTAVLFGHAEITLRTTDEKVINQIQAFIDKYLAAPEEGKSDRLFSAHDVVTAFSPL